MKIKSKQNRFFWIIREPKAQIGYVYQDSSVGTFASQMQSISGRKSPTLEDLSEESEEDLDLAVDISKLTAEHEAILNKSGAKYGMDNGDYMRMLILDNEERESIKKNKLLEAEKAQYSVIEY